MEVNAIWGAACQNAAYLALQTKPLGRGGSKIGNSRKWLWEGAKGLLEPESEKPLSLMQNSFGCTGTRQVSEGARVGKSQRVKNAKGKNFWELRGRKKSSQKIFQKISQISLLLEFKVFPDIFEIFAEDCFLLRSFRKFLPSGFLPLSRFQKRPLGDLCSLGPEDLFAPSRNHFREFPIFDPLPGSFQTNAKF